MGTPVDKGELNIRSLKLMNKALLTMWLCRFGEKESLWRKLIVTKYGLAERGWYSRVPMGPYVTYIWKGIMMEHELFLSRAAYKVELVRISF